MFRTLAFVSALVAASLSTQALAAQSSASSTKPAPTANTKMDSAKTTTSAPATAPKHHHATWTTDQVKEAQQGLAKAGLYKGDVSGKMNKDTEKALKEYQKENHMPVTGKLSDSVLVKLKTA